MQGKDGAVVMCKEKAAGLRLRVKAEVIQTRDDASDVSEITDVPNLTAPPDTKRRRENECRAVVKL